MEWLFVFCGEDSFVLFFFIGKAGRRRGQFLTKVAIAQMTFNGGIQKRKQTQKQTNVEYKESLSKSNSLWECSPPTKKARVSYKTLLIAVAKGNTVSMTRGI